MKKLALLLLILGLAVGGGAAFAAGMVLGPPQPREAADSAFVPTGPLLAPLVFEDGRLSGYVSFEIQLEVPTDRAEYVAARMPLLLHEINLRTFRSPMCSSSSVPHRCGPRPVSTARSSCRSRW